jgi:hypothetical protein
MLQSVTYRSHMMICLCDRFCSLPLRLYYSPQDYGLQGYDTLQFC